MKYLLAVLMGFVLPGCGTMYFCSYKTPHEVIAIGHVKANDEVSAKMRFGMNLDAKLISYSGDIAFKDAVIRCVKE